MTAARQPGKPQAGAILALVLGALAVAGIVAPGRLEAAAAEPVVVNAQTGLAISGFDPVAYFTDKRPRFGRAGLELKLGGAIWRFCNSGNRAEFVEHPDVYRPRFGGYDPVALARGASVPGHPLFWAVTAERLYLFYSAETREQFLVDPGRIIAAAERKWPTIARALAN
jgi:hypothetical protein